MHWTRPLSLLVVGAVAATGLGALVSLTKPLNGEFAVSSAIVVALLVVSVLAMVALGVGNTSPRDSAGYW